MDLKKFLDQTVREVKREVNKKVLKVPEIEQKVYEATSNEPWGPHGTLMGDIAQATRNFNEYQMIMAILWKRLNDTGKNWRHVYKSLTVLEFLVANGAERIIDELREHAYQVQTLVDFQYIEPGGKDQGINVRKKAQTLVGLLNDKDKIREVRNKAASNRDKYRGVSGTGSFSKSGGYSSTGGGYGDQDDDRYGGSSRSGGRDGRDDDRYAGDKDRDKDVDREDRYRDDDRSTRDSLGDRYRDERDRDRFEDDHFGSKGGDGSNSSKYGDDNKYEGSASGYSKDRDRDRSFEDNDRYSARRGGNGGSGDARKTEDFVQDEREPGSLAAAVARAHTNQNNQSQPLPQPLPRPQPSSQAVERKVTASVGGSYFARGPVTDDFDDFNPRGSFAATNALPQDDDTSGVPPATTPTPALSVMHRLPSVTSTSGIGDLFGDSSFEASFVAAPAPPAPVSSILHQSEDLFGSSTFMVAQSSTPSINVSPTTTFPVPPASSGSFEAFTSVSSTESTSLGRSSFVAGPPSNPNPVSRQTSFVPPTHPPVSNYSTSLQAAQPPPTSSYSTSFHTSSGSVQARSNSQMPFVQPTFGGNSSGSHGGLGLVTSLGPGPTTSSYTPGPKPQQKSFQTKSAIWNDTISSGLVDLNISGPKTNPLAELGIDLKDSIFSMQEKRREDRAQPTAGSMGRAMGSGTGLGLAGASGIAPPLSGPSTMGGMNVGMGMRQNNMGMGVNPGYTGAPSMAVQPGYGMSPGIGIAPGYGLIPGMNVGAPRIGVAPGMNPGMVGYGPGVGMAQGGYGQGLGMSGYPNHQDGYR